MEDTIKLFSEVYDYLYENEDSTELLTIDKETKQPTSTFTGVLYHALIDMGDIMLKKKDKRAMDFIKARKDYLMSDREVAAFAITMILEEKKKLEM